MRRLGYVPALDGLRGIAIAIVVGVHYWGYPLNGGSGVDLFFVLSGFLITTLLLEERAEQDAISLRGFYVRRIRRLAPALIAMLAVFSAIAVAKGVDPLPDLRRFGFYTGNLTRAFTDPSAIKRSGLRHLWSLAEEEQFYLLWPALLLLLLRTRRLFALVVALASALMVYRGLLVLHGASSWRVDFGPDTHADGLLLGAAAAILRRRRAVFPAGLLPWAMTAFILPVLFRVPGWSLVGLPVFEFACACLILGAVSGSSISRPLSWGPLVWLGRISYSLYLWHFMLFWAFGWSYQLVALPLSIACAWVSYRYVEQPFRRHRGSRPRLLLGELVPGVNAEGLAGHAAAADFRA